MRVYRYWASVEVHRPGLHTRVWGGSDESERAARAEAERRAAATDWDAVAGAPRPTRDPRTYGYARGVNPEPLVDEALDERGGRAGAVTINRYGARVLNTATLAFIDVDTDDVPGSVMKFLNPDAPVPTAKRPGLLGAIMDALTGRPEPSPGQVRAAVTQAVIDWVQEGRGRGVRVYRTAAGLRVLVTSPAMDPVADGTRDLMRRFGSDPAYVALCRAQECFRARLTPKPWRLRGFDDPHPVINDETVRDGRATAWLEAYTRACAGHAVCELAEAIGERGTPDPTAGHLLRLHDEETGVGTGLPLA